MYPGNLGNSSSHESSLQRSWYDSNLIPLLNSSNILNYFTERSNPFYEKQCNNEIMRMQGFSPEKLLEMTGIEYVLLHAQEPILYVIRQQQRHSPTQVTPIAEYYIIAGIVYQAPDLNSVISSRLANAINSLGSAFTEAQSYSRYHPSRGYWWEFKDQGNHVEKNKAKEKPLQENIGSVFQRERVDALLFDFDQRFGIRKPVLPEKTEETVKTEKQEKEAPTNQNSSSDRPTAGVTVKQEKKMKPLR